MQMRRINTTFYNFKVNVSHFESSTQRSQGVKVDSKFLDIKLFSLKSA